MLSQYQPAAAQPARQVNPAMFSLEESDSYYLVAVDIPSIPAQGSEIFLSQGQLTVESRSEDSQERQTIFRMMPQGKGIKTVYMNGILYLLLPKTKKEMPLGPTAVVTASSKIS